MIEGFRANRRLLGVERVSYDGDGILAGESFQQINGQVERAGQRASGLRFAGSASPGWNSNERIGLCREGRRKSASHRTRYWREMDSNLWFPNRSAPVLIKQSRLP